LQHDLYALDASDGAVLWTRSTAENVTAPAYANDVVYVGSGSQLYAVDGRNGSFLWKETDPSGYVIQSLAIANGVVYYGTDGDGNVHGTVSTVDAATGKLLWTYAADGAIFSSPVIANGVLYFGTHGGSVYAFGLK
jgi:outer membrane protein assembly factor BamB